MPETGTLFIVATPIGNLGDFTERAHEVLSAVELIAAEDTRVTRKLLSAKQINTPLLSYYEGKDESRRREQILSMLQQGKDIAMVSDAGSPGVSDPGFKLIRDAVEAGIAVTTVPGPSAAISALQLSALPSDRFAFFGFLPHKGADRARMLDRIAAFDGTAIVYESPRETAATLKDLADRFPQCPAAICREMTKLFEEVLRGTLSELAHRLNQYEWRGEVVFVIDTHGWPKENEEEIFEKLRQIKNRCNVSDKDLAFIAGQFTELSKNHIYKRLLSEKEEENGS